MNDTAAIKSLLLFKAGLFIGFLVEKYVAWQSRKSDFGCYRFRFSPCLMRKRVQKSQATLSLLYSFQELHLEWKSWVIIVFDVYFFISNFMKSSTVYAASSCAFVRFETMISPSIRLDISLQNRYIFSAQIERKRSEEYLVINWAAERKLWAFFLPRKSA